MATAAPVRRFPLLVGTRAFRLLAVLPSCLVLASGATLWLAVSAADWSIGWLRIVSKTLSLAAMVCCLSPVVLVAQLRWLIDHVRRALAVRACDVELEQGELRVRGGSSHGFHASLSELDEGAIELTRSELTVKPKQGVPLAVSVPDDADERASLEALAASLTAAAAGHAVTHTSDVCPARAVLHCKRCNAPLTPTPSSQATCAFCGAKNAIPDEISARIKSQAAVSARARRDEKLCARLARQPSSHLANLIAFGGGALCIALAAVATFAAASTAFLDDELGGMPHWDAFALALCGLGMLLFTFASSVLVSRGALRVLTLGFSALPSERAGASPRCRNCGAPLPEPSSARVLTRCVYCDSENLGPLDLGREAALITRFSRGELSPARALAQLRKRRFLTRSVFLVGALLLALAAQREVALRRMPKADALTVNVPSTVPDPDSDLAADDGAITFLRDTTLPGTAVAILPNGDDVDVLVRDADGVVHRVHAPDGAVTPEQLAAAPRVPTGRAYAARSAADPLVVVNETGVTCALPNGPPKTIYRAEPGEWLEAPESLGGCSALITTRAEQWAHFFLRRCDEHGASVKLNDARDAALAPDGKTLIASVFDAKTEVFQLALFPAVGTARLLTGGAMHSGLATWSPDGTRIAFLTEPVRDFIQFSKYTGSTALYVVDLHGKLSRLTKGRAPALVRPVWTNRGIWLVEISGTQKHAETTLLQFFAAD